LIIMAIAAVVVMLTVVVPRFKDMVMHAGTEVPEQARLVIGASAWLLANGQMIAIGVAALVTFLGVAWKRGFGRERIEDLVLRLPLIGNMIRVKVHIRTR